MRQKKKKMKKIKKIKKKKTKNNAYQELLQDCRPDVWQLLFDNSVNLEREEDSLSRSFTVSS